MNPKSTNIDSFQYAILIWLHYYDIPNNPQRISNLGKCKSRYDFSFTELTQFEQNNTNMSLNKYNTQNEQIYSSIKNSQNKAIIIHINNRYAAVKPHQNNIKKLLKSFTHTELKKKHTK